LIFAVCAFIKEGRATRKIKPIAFNKIALNGKNLTVKMPPFSVVVIEIK